MNGISIAVIFASDDVLNGFYFILWSKQQKSPNKRKMAM